MHMTPKHNGSPARAESTVLFSFVGPVSRSLLEQLHVAAAQEEAVVAATAQEEAVGLSLRRLPARANPDDMEPYNLLLKDPHLEPGLFLLFHKIASLPICGSAQHSAFCDTQKPARPY